MTVVLSFTFLPLASFVLCRIGALEMGEAGIGDGVVEVVAEFVGEGFESEDGFGV